MASKSTSNPQAKVPKAGREDRLKAALKANMAKRKAQARARADGDDSSKDPVGKPTDA